MGTAFGRRKIIRWCGNRSDGRFTGGRAMAAVARNQRVYHDLGISVCDIRRA
ncbi:hypothetical protein [Micromonospora polyrhachis]|uniref:Uncharacterized protein n=1 Tax=Micromonospora polyrhachis TaxID=1282883 RepID=A0A7W7SPI7_9ACTN|nr:hypothetical protein [Micromonospora polyrhachis]MBB4958585.1 hypothetical protein [Micromonospora polyrhachis]